MAYKVIVDFKDLRDGGYAYKSGDKYPHSGNANPDRAKHLMTPTSQRGALIEEVAEEVVKVAKPVTKKKQEK
jgi:hypothetical protein